VNARVSPSGIIAPVSHDRPDDAPGHHRTTAPIRPPDGEEVWRLSKRSRTQTCALSPHTGAGVGWDVQVLEEGELLFCHPCANEERARFVATCFREDYRRTGWTEDE
jgi:hypothetical protein